MNSLVHVIQFHCFKPACFKLAWWTRNFETSTAEADTRFLFVHLLAEGDAAKPFNVFNRSQLTQSIDRRLDQINGVN